MMQLSDIVTDIQDEINKGDSVTDAQVQSKIRDALTYLELTHSWAAMDRFVCFDLDTTANEPRVLPIPSGLKAIEFVRLSLTTGFQYLNEVKARDVTKIEVDVPQGYWKDGMEFLWLDNTPAEDYAGEMSYVQFTPWDASDTFEPWLFQVAAPLIKYQALLFLSVFLREPELGTMYKGFRDESLKAALDMNEQLEYSNQSNQMQFK